MTVPTTQPTGLIAILRGIAPPDALAVGRVLVDAGFPVIEVPLNSPEPFRSIERLATELGDRCRIGAGTVVDVADVARTAAAGATVLVAPNTDEEIIRTAVAAGLEPYPGVATISEAFRAVKAGARTLKLFPADAVGIAGMRAWRAVLPTQVEMLPVGGIDDSNLAEWLRGGAAGAGLGTSLYRPGDSPDQVGARARNYRRIWVAAAG